MTYGERLQKAIARRESVIGRVISRLELSKVAGCSRQNIGMILTNAKGTDQKLTTESHAAVSAFLKVNPEWLLSEKGSIEPPGQLNAPSYLSAVAVEMGVLFDMIPLDDRIRRAQAFNLATSAIMQVLQDVRATNQATLDSGKPSA